MFVAMKKLIFLWLLLPFASFSQTNTGSGFPLKEGKVVYEAEADAAGMKKDSIYAVSQRWISNSFTAGKSVLQTADPGAGLAIGNVVESVSVTSANPLFQAYAVEMNYQVKIISKDAQYRILFYAISVKSVTLGSMTGDVEIPLENFAHTMQETKFKPRQTERNTQMKNAIDARFFQLMDNFNKLVKKSGGIIF